MTVSGSRALGAIAMKPSIQRLKRFLDSPYVHLAIGVFLMAASLSEAWESLSSDLRHFRLRASHGVGLVGVFYVLNSFVEVLESVVEAVEAVEEVERGVEEEEEEKEEEKEG